MCGSSLRSAARGAHSGERSSNAIHINRLADVLAPNEANHLAGANLAQFHSQLLARGCRFVLGPYGSDSTRAVAEGRPGIVWNHGAAADDVQRLPGVVSLASPASRSSRSAGALRCFAPAPPSRSSPRPAAFRATRGRDSSGRRPAWA